MSQSTSLICFGICLMHKIYRTDQIKHGSEYHTDYSGPETVPTLPITRTLLKVMLQVLPKLKDVFDLLIIQKRGLHTEDVGDSRPSTDGK